MGVYCCGKPLNVWYQPAPHRRTPNLKHWGTSPMCSLLPISMPMYPPVITRGNGRSPIHRGFYSVFSNIFSILSMIFPWKPPFAVGFPWFSHGFPPSTPPLITGAWDFPTARFWRKRPRCAAWKATFIGRKRTLPGDPGCEFLPNFWSSKSLLKCFYH